LRGAVKIPVDVLKASPTFNVSVSKERTVFKVLNDEDLPTVKYTGSDTMLLDPIRVSRSKI
jgi:hypothetical protein